MLTIPCSMLFTPFSMLNVPWHLSNSPLPCVADIYLLPLKKGCFCRNPKQNIIFSQGGGWGGGAGVQRSTKDSLSTYLITIFERLGMWYHHSNSADMRDLPYGRNPEMNRWTAFSQNRIQFYEFAGEMTASIENLYNKGKFTSRW